VGVGGVLVDRQAHRRQYRPKKVIPLSARTSSCPSASSRDDALPRVKTGSKILERCRHAVQLSDYCLAAFLYSLLLFNGELTTTASADEKDPQKDSAVTILKERENQS